MIHVDELADAYALGSLAPGERAEVDAHVATCDACARALGEAEATIAALIDETVVLADAPPRLGQRIAASASAGAHRMAWPRASLLALAASLVVAVGAGSIALIEYTADVRQAAHESAVIATLADAHFLHVSLTARASAVPVSKAIYARDGAWLYVVVDGAACACRVIARSATGSTDLGPPDVRGSTSTLFTRAVRRPTAVALVDASGAVLADATLAYPPE